MPSSAPSTPNTSSSISREKAAPTAGAGVTSLGDPGGEGRAFGCVLTSDISRLHAVAAAFLREVQALVRAGQHALRAVSLGQAGHADRDADVSIHLRKLEREDR